MPLAIPLDLLDRGLAEPVLKRSAGQFARGRPVRIEHVTAEARAFVIACLRHTLGRTVWVVCPDVRTQEGLAAELTNWMEGVLLFPELARPAGEEILPDAETESERLSVLRRLQEPEAHPVVVITAAEWASLVPSAESLSKESVTLRTGQQIPLEALEKKLLAAGYESVPQIFGRGQFSRRGGILDIYSPQHAIPVRVEFFDEEIESIREFDLDGQTSIRTLEGTEILLREGEAELAPLSSYRKRDHRVISVENCWPEAEADLLAEGDPTRTEGAFYPLGFGEFGAGDLVLDEVRRERFFRQIEEWQKTGWLVAMFCANEGERERFLELLAGTPVAGERLLFLEGAPERGFTCPAAHLAVLSDAEIFGRSTGQRARRLALRRERFRSGRAGMDFTEFEEGDYVVHLEHGIGRFEGLEKLPAADGTEADVLAIEFAQEARLYVPLDQAWQVARYVGIGKRNPDLSELGDSKWQRAKKKAEQSIYDYAASMLRIQAEREVTSGHACSPDTHWQEEFERSFPFRETTDQLRAIEESKRDMESTRPMDRLICGDVGFGKTEVAIRAAFKAVMGGKQVAVLAPTTVLAQQHYQTFRERMSDYPISVDVLSRYRTKSEQQKALQAAQAGSLDILVGTHRILSADVHFKDLGLVVVDEEQRFGVKHKEALKARFRLVDVLTLSATPIPRTLYLSLMGARDMSLIETPPPNRQPVETSICGYDERIIREAINREIERGGQVYFLHNRVRTIDRVADRIRTLCPGAKVGVGHGQMDENELEEVMGHFVSGRLDVLVSTTIIESGLDIPNANTIIIDRADLFGLADLYQLRERVGRSGTKAFAYLILPRELLSVGAARKRISAIKQYSELGAGFKIAMRDLEIRGAGNLLGTAQSGHILAVGFDLYCKMLKAAVASLKGRREITPQSAGLRIDFLEMNEAAFATTESWKAPAFLPTLYMRDSRQRIEGYRRLAECSGRREVDKLAAEWRDRFGPLPPAVENLLLTTRIRAEAVRKAITLVEVKERKLMLTRGGDFVLVGNRFPRLTAREPDSKLREILALIAKMGGK